MRRKFEGALDADVLVDFMKRLIKDAGRNVYLVPDNLRVHHGKPVKAWLAEHRREIDVFLPAQLQPGAQHQRDGHKLWDSQTSFQLKNHHARYGGRVKQDLRRARFV